MCEGVTTEGHISVSLRALALKAFLLPLVMISKSVWSNKLDLQGEMCLDTTGECHGKTERRGGAAYQIRMEKHVGTTHGKTAEVQKQCRATMVERLFGLLICQQTVFNQKRHWIVSLQPVRLLFFFSFSLFLSRNQ